MEDLRPGRYLTFGGRYLTFGGKNQNSAALRFCIWPFYTFLCDISTIQWKLLDEFAKVWKNDQKRHFWPQYLTFGGKNQNSAALRFCIWPFYTFLCDISTIQWKLLDEFAKVWKNDQKRQVFPPLWPWPWPGDLETYARIFMYPRSIYPASFVKFR